MLVIKTRTYTCLKRRDLLQSLLISHKQTIYVEDIYVILSINANIVSYLLVILDTNEHSIPKTHLKKHFPNASNDDIAFVACSFPKTK